MDRLTPLGTARERWARAAGTAAQGRPQISASAGPDAFEADDFEPTYLGWEVARCARGLGPEEERALASLAAAALASVVAGSTRLPLAGPSFVSAMNVVGAAAAAPLGRRLVARAREGAAGDPVLAVLGRAGERTPLIVDGEWLYVERMHVLEEGFCARVRSRLASPEASAAATRDARVESRALTRAANAVVSGPPVLTDEQRRAVREGLRSPLALIAGGPGTGKTATVVALLRALAWLGTPMDSVAIAAPTGKAAQRLSDAIAAGLAGSHDLADAGLRGIAPAPQTLHRLLGWSPSRGRFARHENDPLSYRVVVVDEASMIDLAMMHRLVRALRDDARLVLLGDADQLPSVEAGAVFRDLCAGLGASRLTANLRVSSDPSARGIVSAALAVNAGGVRAHAEEGAGPDLDAALTVRTRAEDIAFAGVELLAASWATEGDAVLERWWTAHVALGETLARGAASTYAWRAGVFAPEDAAALRALFEHHARARILCATRVLGFETGADALNDRLVTRLRPGAARGRARTVRDLPPGAPVSVQRNDYDRGLYNGDQGIVVRVDDGTGPRPMVVFPRRSTFDVFPLDGLPDLVPAFATTVHKAQGSEYDHVALVLPEVDLPLLTRELVYTAITRARRSVLLVGHPDLLRRAVARTVERYSGVAERLAGMRKR